MEIAQLWQHNRGNYTTPTIYQKISIVERILGGVTTLIQPSFQKIKKITHTPTVSGAQTGRVSTLLLPPSPFPPFSYKNCLAFREVSPLLFLLPPPSPPPSHTQITTNPPEFHIFTFFSTNVDRMRYRSTAEDGNTGYSTSEEGD